MSTHDDSIMLDVEKFYISEYDRFYCHFDKTHPLSAAQLKEKEKHARIARKRDNPIPDTKLDI